MEALKAEIALKRKSAQGDSNRPAKYMRRGEIEKLKEEQEKQEREVKEAKELEAKEAQKVAVKAKNRLVHSQPPTHHNRTILGIPRLQTLLLRPSTSQTKRQFAVSASRANLSAYSESQTKIVGCVCVR